MTPSLFAAITVWFWCLLLIGAMAVGIPFRAWRVGALLGVSIAHSFVIWGMHP